jgi:hypothetical protein
LNTALGPDPRIGREVVVGATNDRLGLLGALVGIIAKRERLLAAVGRTAIVEIDRDCRVALLGESICP